MYGQGKARGDSSAGAACEGCVLAGAVGAAEQNHLCTLPPRESQSLAEELLPLPNHKGARGDEPGTRAATLFLAPKKPGLLRHWHRHHRYLCHHPNSSGGGLCKANRAHRSLANAPPPRGLCQTPNRPGSAAGMQPAARRAATPPLLAEAAVSPALPRTCRAEDARRASAGTGGTDPRSQITFKLLPS